MPGSIFVLHDDGTLVEMKEMPYEAEALWACAGLWSF
jgi:hypothetical protein